MNIPLAIHATLISGSGVDTARYDVQLPKLNGTTFVYDVTFRQMLNIIEKFGEDVDLSQYSLVINDNVDRE